MLNPGGVAEKQRGPLKPAVTLISLSPPILGKACWSSPPNLGEKPKESRVCVTYPITPEPGLGRAAPAAEAHASV